MADFRDLMPDHTEMPDRLFGFFAHAVTDFAKKAYVIIPEFDPKLEWGPCPWQARDATSLPAKGDPCLIVWYNRRTPWVVAWWPF